MTNLPTRPPRPRRNPKAPSYQSWAKQIGNIALIAEGIMGAVFFTILLVAGNTMAQSVRERTGELGALKAIGFTNAQVLCQVMAESCLLALAGRSARPGLVVGLRFARGPHWRPAADVLFSGKRFDHRPVHQRGAGRGHWNFARAPGHAPARGRRS
jgi:hypothetical protein